MQSDFSAQTNNFSLWQLALNTIQELETENGILASGKGELFGCVFGRDSLITALKLLKTYQKTQDPYLLNLTKKILGNLADLQGSEINIESGEQPGKILHEYRTADHEHLSVTLSEPWFVYPDGTIRNYDTVDATPLFLIAAQRYYQISKDEDFLQKYLLNIHAALNWLLVYGDSNTDGFIDYSFSEDRKYGGLRVQSWMDSTESLFHEDGQPFAYPVAPVEVQAYSYAALKLWAKYFRSFNPEFSQKLFVRATDLKSKFNKKFTIRDRFGTYFAAGIDGNGKQISAVRSSFGHCLWAALVPELDNELDSIIDASLVAEVASRLLKPDLFESKAGIRTLSTLSPNYRPYSYHNGSIWPHDNSIIAEGLDNFGFVVESNKVRSAMLSAITHFKTPIELFAYENEHANYTDYLSDINQLACKKQAWSAASLLTDAASISLDPNFVQI